MGDQGTGRRARKPARQAELARGAELARRAGEAVSRSRTLRAAAIETAMLTADTEQEVARTLARLAGQRPGNAPHLLSMSRAAARQAARERQRVSGLRGEDGGV